MISDRNSLCASVLEAAADSALGISIITNNVPRARTMLYNFRRNFPNPDYDNIIIRPSPTEPDTKLWLLKPTQTETKPNNNKSNLNDIEL